MKEKEIDVPEVGKFVLLRPKAGTRNKALVKAEGPDGIKQTVMAIELLPSCIKNHPFDLKKYPGVAAGATVSPLRQALDDMETYQYDLLLAGMGDLLDPPKGGVQKKSEPSSDAEK